MVYRMVLMLIIEVLSYFRKCTTTQQRPWQYGLERVAELSGKTISQYIEWYYVKSPRESTFTAHLTLNPMYNQDEHSIYPT